MIRAVTYARVSGQRQVEHGYSLEDQARTLAAFCQRQGYLLIEHVADEGVTGRLEDRPALRRLHELVDAKVVDVVVIVKLDRVGREQRIILNALHAIRSKGVRVEFVEHAAGDTPAERLQLGVLGAVAEYQWENIRQLTMQGRYNKARAGKLPGVVPPYGYRLVRKAEALALPEFAGRDGEALIEESEAALVREMFARFTSGMSDRAISDALNAEGYRTRRGNLWRRSTIRRILLNPCYAEGRLIYGKNSHLKVDGTFPSGRQKIRTVAQDPSLWAYIPCPVLIDAEAWRRAEALRRESGLEIVGRPSRIWLLKGVVWCGSCVTQRGKPFACCGHRMSHNQHRKGYEMRYYYCTSNTREHHPFCGTFHQAEPLEAMAYEMVAQIVETPGFLAEQARAHARRNQAGAGDLARQCGAAEAELVNVNGQLSRLADQALTGLLPPDIIREKATSLTTQREALQRRVRDLKARLGRYQDPEEAAAEGERLAVEARAMWDAAQGDPAQLQKLYQVLLHITLKKGELPLLRIRNYWT